MHVALGGFLLEIWIIIASSGQIFDECLLIGDFEVLLVPVLELERISEHIFILEVLLPVERRFRVHD